MDWNRLTATDSLSGTLRRWLRSGGSVLAFRWGRSQEGPAFAVTRGQDVSDHLS